MSNTWVLRFPQVDLPNQPILLHVTSKDGHDLDLDLLATDGDAAFRGKLRNRNLAKLKSHNYDGTDEDWSNILRHTLILKANAVPERPQHKDLEVSCSISGKEPKSKLSIGFRTRVEDITHRLGVVELAYSEDTDDVDLFGWACQAVEQRDGFRERLITEKEKSQSIREIINRLEEQLASLIQAKSEHEGQLLSKFQLLINEKSLKIRNQQRVLRTAQVDTQALEEMRLSIKDESKSTTTTKRKRHDKVQGATDDNDHDEESDGFDAMDVDTNNNNNTESESEGAQTEETETASEDDMDQEVPRKGQQSASRQKASPPPPARVLPFQKKGTNSKASNLSASSTATSKAKPNELDEETASEDDEL